MVQRIIINQRLLIFVKPYFIILVYECMSNHSVIHFSIYLLQPALGQIIFVCTLSGHTEIDITCRSNQQIADRTFYFGKYIPVYQTGPYIDTVKIPARSPTHTFLPSSKKLVKLSLSPELILLVMKSAGRDANSAPLCTADTL